MSILSDMETYGQDIQAAIADQLRAERTIQGRTLDDLAHEVGISKITLHRYLHSQRDIPIKTLAGICAALNVSMGEIIRRAEARLQAQKLSEGDSE